MGLLIPLGLAKLIFYSLTLWRAFKALKVPKTRRKIPRPVIRRTADDEVNKTPTIQTHASTNSLTASQRARRTKIKESLKVCLVWIIWSHLIYYLDLVYWAIPFYDELQFIFIIWLICLGPIAADTFMKYCVQRLVKPYEKSFDSILGTSHNILLVTVYILTSGPRYLNLRWQQWQAKRFNKSLLKARQEAPPTRLPSVINHHLKSILSGDSLDKVPKKTNPKNITTQASLSSASDTQPLTSSNFSHSSNDLSPYDPPYRMPTLSRKLSAGFSRSVSMTNSKRFLEIRSSEYRRAPSFEKPSNYFHATAHLNSLHEPKPVRFSKNSVSLPPVCQSPILRVDSDRIDKEEEDENNSIIIYSDRSLSYPEKCMEGSLISKIPTQNLTLKRPRTHEEDAVISGRKAKRHHNQAEKKSTISNGPDNLSPHLTDTIGRNSGELKGKKNQFKNGTDIENRTKDVFNLVSVKSSLLTGNRPKRDLRNPQCENTQPFSKLRSRDAGETPYVPFQMESNGYCQNILGKSYREVGEEQKTSSISQSSGRNHFSTALRSTGPKPAPFPPILSTKKLRSQKVTGKRSSSTKRSEANKKRLTITDHPYSLLVIKSKREISGKLGGGGAKKKKEHINGFQTIESNSNADDCSSTANILNKINA
ncbi:hypothetical protein BY996DRAFT_1195850 [Phakopsora pachyrhizi]|uniref:Expressed protein n=1 Tax=Phakopsora pachyrhizi TaxID=170000 RepID=A0AAV0AFL6_PHAPC|nr:hypothetical protein BY996DRAFT_1195850 [Phakopsora pachyrhizi]CAH7666920.1 expressed protein [Phakopsora pachyrhizi]